jgi:hypothetical protein
MGGQKSHALDELSSDLETFPGPVQAWGAPQGPFAAPLLRD